MPQSPKANVAVFLKKNKKPLLIGSLAALCIIALVALVVVITSNNRNKNVQNPTNNTTSPTTPDQVLNYAATISNDNPTCTLSKVEYKESAFSIGVPNGWIYEVSGGTVSIMQDDTNTTAAFIYTAKLEKDISAQDFLTAFSTIFNKTIVDVKGTFSTSNVVASADKASADITSTIGKDSMKGKMLVEKSAGFVTLKSYWAPVAEYAQREPLLSSVVGCFARTKILTDAILASAKNRDVVQNDPVTAGFQTYTGKYFKLSKPTNFTVTSETDSGIDLTRTDGNAGFSYAYATGVVGSYTPQSWAQKALPQYAKIQSLKLSGATTIPSQISGEAIQSFTFTGKLNNTVSVTGKATIGVIKAPYYGIGTSYSSAFWAIQVATPSAWSGAKSTLQTMQDSLEITDIGATRKNTLLPANRPIESVGSTSITSHNTYENSVNDAANENWSDAMRGYTSATSPTTGESFDVPLNSWNSAGPDGAGYYHELANNSLEKLE